MPRSNTPSRRITTARTCLYIGVLLTGAASFCTANAQPVPSVKIIFPAGVQSAESADITVAGEHIGPTAALVFSQAGTAASPAEPDQFHVSFSGDVAPGHMDLWTLTDNGITAPHSFVVSNRSEHIETEPNDAVPETTTVVLNSTVNGRIDKAGDIDCFRFSAMKNQRVIIECQAERMDSQLRAVLEVLDTDHMRLAVNRGYFGTDPLIDFTVPHDGDYVVRVTDLISTGSDLHQYRLDVDVGPRVVFAIPNVIQRGKPARVTLYGWNLNSEDVQPGRHQFDQVEVDLPASIAQPVWPLPVRLQSNQSILAGKSTTWHLPGSHAPLVFGVVDAPVTVAPSDNHSPEAAQSLTIPCEVSGQLIAGDEQDWFTFEAVQGEVFYFEALGRRIQSPVDLQLHVFALSNSVPPIELVTFNDELRNTSETFPTAHPDPGGRWVCPADGRYLLMIRNLTGGLSADPRRVYRLSIRREDPDVRIIAVPHANASAGINVQRDGRTVVDLLAIRRRGFSGSIRVSAHDLPAGVECPDTWFGPGVNRTVAVVSADRNSVASTGELKLSATSKDLQQEIRPVIGGIVTRSATPIARARLTSQMRMAVAGEANVRLVADAHQSIDHHIYGTLPARHSPGGIVDVSLQVVRQDQGHQADVRLTGIGLPDTISTGTSTIAAGQSEGVLSFYLPPSMRLGHYSFTIRGETTVPATDGKTRSVTVFSNPVTIDVQPAAFLVSVDPFAATQAKRGEIFQVPYHCRRLNGFIGKMHTELASPGIVTDVPGLRGRGVTFVGQTDQGTIQVEVNSDASLGSRKFLRLFTVGVVEDEPVFHGSCFVALEITE